MSCWILLNRPEIEDDKWNALVASALNEHVYGYTNYLDIVSDSWKGFVFGNYEAVLPVSLKSKLGLKYFGQINHVQRLNVFSVFQVVPSPKELEKLMLESVSYIDIVTEQDLFADLMRKEKTNLVLPLTQSIEVLQKGFNTNSRRGIKKANALGALFKKCSSSSISDAIEIFKTQKNYGLGDSWFKNLKSISELNFAQIYSVSIDGQNMAFAMVLVSEKKVTLIFTALHENGKEIGAMPFLISELIKIYSNSNRTFDFEGSDNPGIARFYSSFGASIEKYYHFQSKGILKRTKELLKGK